LANRPVRDAAVNVLATLKHHFYSLFIRSPAGDPNAVGLGSTLLWLAVRFAATRSDSAARQLFVGSIIYLPLIWIAMICSKV